MQRRLPDQLITAVRMKTSHSATPGVVVITGASAGVGRAIVHQFARAGWRIGLIARDAAALEQVRCEVEELGGNPIRDSGGRLRRRGRLRRG